MTSLLAVKDRLFYGWIVVITAVIIGTLTFGTRNSFGVFFKSLEGEFGLNRAMTSGIFSLHLVFSIIFVVAGGWLLDKYGPRRIVFLMGVFTGLSFIITSMTTSPWQIYLSYSLLLALGSGPAYTILMATVSRWFVKRRGLAIGIASTGSPIGQVALAPFATFLMLNVGWRTTFLIIGLIAGLIVMSLSLLLRKDPAEIGTIPDGKKSSLEKTAVLKNSPVISNPLPDFSLRKIIADRNYWLLWIIGLFQGFCLFLIFTHIVPYATDMRMPAMSAAMVLSIMAGVSILGRLIMGNVSDKISSRTTVIICAIAMAATLLWLIRADNPWMIYLFAALFGFAYGGFNPAILTLITDVFGVRNIGVIMGTLGFGFTLGSAVGPFVGGLVFDANNSYSLAFALGAACILLAAFLTTLVRRDRPAQIVRHQP